MRQVCDNERKRNQQRTVLSWRGSGIADPKKTSTMTALMNCKLFQVNSMRRRRMTIALRRGYSCDIESSSVGPSAYLSVMNRLWRRYCQQISVGRDYLMSVAYSQSIRHSWHGAAPLVFRQNAISLHSHITLLLIAPRCRIRSLSFWTILPAPVATTTGTVSKSAKHLLRTTARPIWLPLISLNN